MSNIYNKILTSEDPFEYIYDCISSMKSIEEYRIMSDLYNQTYIDFGFHPDDNVEKIIYKMIDIIENENNPLSYS